ncbi:hypothetical protein WA158_005467 [Blastocystis sp. Blastoise]
MNNSTITLQTDLSAPIMHAESDISDDYTLVKPITCLDSYANFPPAPVFIFSESESDSDSDIESYTEENQEAAEITEYFNNSPMRYDFLDESLPPPNAHKCNVCQPNRDSNPSPVNICYLNNVTSKPKRSRIDHKDILQFEDGTKIIGDFKKKSPVGHGICYSSNGTVYIGSFIYLQLNGIGTIIYQNGDRYEGQVLNCRRNGKGVLYKNNGNVLDSSWSNDKQDGKSILYYTDGTQYESYWEKGMPIGTGILKQK